MEESKVIWKKIREFQDFEISEEGDIRDEDGQKCSTWGEGTQEKVKIKGKIRIISKILREHFPPDDHIDDIWKQ